MIMSRAQKECELASWHLFSFRVSGLCCAAISSGACFVLHGPLFHDLGFLSEAVRYFTAEERKRAPVIPSDRCQTSCVTPAR